MPRKSKEESPKTEKEIVSKRSKSTTKNDTSSTKKTVAKKATALKTEELKKVSTKTVRNSSSKSSVAKKTKSKSTKTTVKKSEKKLINNSTNVVEYYDLPQKYNQTVVKVLAQTPKTLFVYWEISDDDIEKFKNDYGENFFETTKPVLIIHNDTLNYSFEVDINDFANSWYLHVNDSNSDYRIELGRFNQIIYT